MTRFGTITRQLFAFSHHETRFQESALNPWRLWGRGFERGWKIVTSLVESSIDLAHDSERVKLNCFPSAF
jgi:hypothetical protein